MVGLRGLYIYRKSELKLVLEEKYGDENGECGQAIGWLRMIFHE